MRHYESYLEFLSEERVEEATTMLCSSFLKFNSIWKKLGVPYEEAYTVNKARMIEGLTINCSTLGIDAQTNKVIFVCTTVELAHYMDEELMPRTYRWSNFINQWSYKLEHKEWQKMKGIEVGKYIMGDLGGIEESHVLTGETFHLYVLSMKFIYQMGYIGYYARSTHPGTTRMLLKMGGKVINRVELIDEEFPQMQGQYIELIYLHFPDFKYKKYDGKL